MKFIPEISESKPTRLSDGSSMCPLIMETAGIPNISRLLLFDAPLEFRDILVLEHLHVIHWMIYTPDLQVRERQILSVSNAELERYLYLLDPGYVSLLLCSLHPETRITLLHRLKTCSTAKVLSRLSPKVQEKLLRSVDNQTRESIRAKMKTLPHDFYPKGK